LISRQSHKLATLPLNAVLGTSSYRRASQLLSQRPDLKIVDMRGNIGTRIRKALDPDNGYDAIVLAYAGLERLGYEAIISEVLPAEIMLPAPGQGAIGVQTRDDPALLTLLHLIHHIPTALAVTAERAFLSGLGGGCSVPVAAYARWNESQLHLRGRVSAQDGSQRLDIEVSRPISTAAAAAAIGLELAQQALDQGARQLMEQSL
jgi:hydroxymethylbilane synthase